MQSFLPTILHIKYFVDYFSTYILNRLWLLVFLIPCLSLLLHISTHGASISPKFREGFFFTQCLYLPHRLLTDQEETQPEMHCWALTALWIALVSQKPAFHVSDFSQGALMLIHFTLLTHLFFFRLSYLFWAFKYIYGKKERKKKNFGLSLCSFWRETSMIQWWSTFFLTSLIPVSTVWDLSPDFSNICYFPS